MFLASVIVFVTVVMIQLLQMPTAECLFINRRFPVTDTLHTPQKSIGTVVSKCPKCDCRISTRKKRVVGGIEAKENEFPSRVSLRTEGQLYCGATVITKQHLLTAAHCVTKYTAETIEASLGERNRELTYDVNKKTVRIREIIRHPGFNLSSSDNDIAILKLNGRISFNTSQIQPACLPNSENRDYTGYFGTISGWDLTDKWHKSLSNKMQKVEVPIIPNENCRIYSSYRYSANPITDNMMCTGYYFTGQNACNGLFLGVISVLLHIITLPSTLELIDIDVGYLIT
ncbi:trypsin-like isoform X2 [Planococcus citri]|uniref:trypsin-like isoform X2 n=1 Tax=Planococcus citri TaxID=170843 RepID=UPI0031F7C4E0